MQTKVALYLAIVGEGGDDKVLLVSSVVRIFVYWTELPQRKHFNIHCHKWCIIGDIYLGGFWNNKRLISLIYWTVQYWIWWI